MAQQRIIGLIGGMSWESSAEYDRIINQAIRSRLGALHAARCLLWSFDFGEIEALQRAGRWDDATEIILLVKQEDSRIPLFDTTRTHAEAAADRALS